MGLNQIEFGKLADASENSQTAYEKGKTAPNIAYLLKLQEHGVDIGYILTGQRYGAPVVRPDEADRWLDEAEKILDEIGDVAEARKRMGDRLTGIALDAALPDRIRGRADFMLSFLGDEEAKQRRAACVRKVERERENARMVMRESFDRAARISGWRPDEELRNAVLKLCEMMQIANPAGIEAQLLDIPLEMLLRAVKQP